MTQETKRTRDKWRSVHDDRALIWDCAQPLEPAGDECALSTGVYHAILTASNLKNTHGWDRIVRDAGRHNNSDNLHWHRSGKGS